MRALLRKRYAAPEWALIEEVRSETGYRGPGRYADAVAMNTWPSRGLEILGFEIKVTRQDWLKELKDPAKSSAIQKYCDRWWVVAGNRNIVKPGELPPTWGLMIATRARVVIATDAPKLAPEGLDRPFVASLFRSMHETLSSTEKNNESYERGRQDGMLEASNKQPWEIQTLKMSYDRLQADVRLFQEKTGISLQSWEYSGIGEAIELLRDLTHGPTEPGDALRAAATPLRRLLSYIEAVEKVMALKASGKLQLSM